MAQNYDGGRRLNSGMSDEKLELTANQVYFHKPHSPKGSIASMSMDPAFFRDHEHHVLMSGRQQFGAGDHYLNDFNNGKLDILANKQNR